MAREAVLCAGVERQIEAAGQDTHEDVHLWRKAGRRALEGELQPEEE